MTHPVSLSTIRLARQPQRRLQMRVSHAPAGPPRVPKGGGASNQADVIPLQSTVTTLPLLVPPLPSLPPPTPVPSPGGLQCSRTASLRCCKWRPVQATSTSLRRSTSCLCCRRGRDGARHLVVRCTESSVASSAGSALGRGCRLYARIAWPCLPAVALMFLQEAFNSGTHSVNQVSVRTK